MDFMRADFENGGKYSDMTLVCGDKKWKVHSAVMCPQSKCMDEEYRTFKVGFNRAISRSTELAAT